jgi:UDP-N-acetyl-D-glucosamine/UDP-N-acetyl-D-galactosamine dehydrogenase
MNERVAVIGLGYVGLPVALALAKRHPGTVGFDIKAKRIAELREGRDSTGEAEPEALKASTIRYTDQLEDLRGSTFFVVTVPTPIDANKQPDLTAVIKATEAVGKVLEKGGVVVYESTVYPGVTEDICRPILARVSGLKPGVDFKVGYSPERINPGDREHSLERVIKVVSGEDQESLDRVADIYGAIITAGVHRAPSIKAAEAAKVIENTQRDLNIALMNELAIIFDKMGIPTRDVLSAAGTKWNFLKFVPGLVGGHCIGVDPYYLTAKAELLNYHPQVILAGRRINDGMGQYIAQRLVKMLIATDRPVKNARVAVLGLTFKENVPDLRNSRVPDILHELDQFGIKTFVHDPISDAEEAHEEYGLHLTDWDNLTDLDAVVLAVSHKQYDEKAVLSLVERMKKPGVLVDVKSAFDRSRLPQGLSYWSL